MLAGVLAWERRWLPRPAYRRFTLLAFVSLAVARVLLWFGWMPLREATSGWAGTVYQGDVLEWLHRTPVDLCVTAFLLLAAVMLAVDPLRRLRLTMRHVRRQPTGPPAPPAAFHRRSVAGRHSSSPSCSACWRGWCKTRSTTPSSTS